VHLATQKTACKAEDICGMPEPEQSKQNQSSCDPSSGCC